MSCDVPCPGNMATPACLLLLSRGLGGGAPHRLLRGVRMVGAGVHVKLARHLLAAPVSREHAAHRATDDFLGSPGKKLFQSLRPQASGLPCVPLVILSLQL